MSAELLAAVLAKPDDDAARAAYAAHLRKASDPRGEFVDLQLDLAKHADAATPAAKKLAKRITELHKKHSAKWAKPLRALGKDAKWEFHRGFVRRLTIEQQTRISALNDVFAIEPVTEVVISYPSAAWWKTLFASAGMRRLTKLVVLAPPPVNKAVVASLVKANLPKLVELRIGLLADAEVRTLATAKLPALRQLAIGGGGHGVELGAKGVEAILKSPLGKKLEILELDRCEIAPRIANLVCASKLARFSASVATFDAVEGQLRARFGSDFVVEDEPSFDYLLLGTAGISR